MKRMIATLAAICAVSGSAWAQDAATDSSEAYVLEQARKKYLESSGTGTQPSETTTTQQPAAQPLATTTTTTTTSTTTTATSQAATESSTTVIVQSGDKNVEIFVSGDSSVDGKARDYPYWPFVISFVPGVSFPFGIHDTSISAAPIGALTGSVFGAQGSGVFNIADGEITGIQGAGVFNIANGAIKGFQGAGVFNLAGDTVRGMQGAGVFNIAESVDGVQAAGVFNIAGSVHGVQMAGVLNVADKAQGAMVGLVNIADELDGIAIGLVNIIGNGINDISLDYQFDSSLVYATLRTGTPFLYASFFAGQGASQFARSTEGLTVGAGLGHRFHILFLTADIELSSETPIDPTSIAEIVAAIKSPASLRATQYQPWDTSFGSVRASFGFGKRKGFGPYLGIKADFAPTGSEAIPMAMRTAFGSAEAYRLELFGTSLDIYPKLFLGIKF